MSKNRSFKIIILGNQAVGKTSILEQYINKSFNNKYKATLGANFLTKKVVMDKGEIMLQIWDTAGQELFQSLGTSFYRGSDACVLVFDVTSSKSFENLQPWREEFIFQIGQDQSIPFLVIANKIDLDDQRVVSKGRAKKWCDEYNLLYCECSAKNGVGIVDGFNELCMSILENAKSDEDLFNPNIQLKRSFVKKKKCKC